MKVRTTHILFGILIATLLLLAVTWAAQPDKIVLEKCGEKKESVHFDHTAHVARESNCTKCHHTDEGLTADSGEAQKCRDCHFEPKDDALDCSEMSPKKNPYHMQCMGCHKDAVKVDAAAKAPTKCAGCHLKK